MFNSYSNNGQINVLIVPFLQAHLLGPTQSPFKQGLSQWGVQTVPVGSKVQPTSQVHLEELSFKRVRTFI